LKSFDVLLLIPGENTNINMIIFGGEVEKGSAVFAGDSVVAHLNLRQGTLNHSPEPKAGR
jgi:hypothetical protein